MSQNPIKGGYILYLIPVLNSVRFLFQVRLDNATGNEHQDYIDEFAEGVVYNLIEVLSAHQVTSGYYTIYNPKGCLGLASDRIANSFRQSCTDWGIWIDEPKTHLEPVNLSNLLPCTDQSDQLQSSCLLLVALPHQLILV